MTDELDRRSGGRLARALIGEVPIVGGVATSLLEDALDRFQTKRRDERRANLETLLQRVADAREEKLPDATRAVLDDPVKFESLLARIRELTDDVHETIAPVYVAMAADWIVEGTRPFFVDCAGFLRSLRATEATVLPLVVERLLREERVTTNLLNGITDAEAEAVRRVVAMLLRHYLAEELPLQQTVNQAQLTWGLKVKDRPETERLARYVAALGSGDARRDEA